ncbi:glycoside hydrolase family 10 protein [Patellaria atrata CBS 101060]|uniref:Beta-xylanase n=1 Tax=Patellaria atrata CBS 101060 TaxID=1346257 RepID=A0A9P4S828_9PEZI|nr:glycoside hydrolase family 10 protein [Patellaria atrata CBS 101060]
MKTTASILAALATSPLVAAAPTIIEHEKRGWVNWTSPGLNDLARKAGLMYFGTAIDNPSLNNTKYLSIARDAHEFGQVTPANGQKWMYTEPEQGVFSFEMGDAIINPAIASQQIRRCHTTLWHNQLPDWLTSRNWTSPELVSILETHIAAVVGHYKGLCYAWDVVNEAFNEDGTFRSTIWLDTIGPSYIETAFKAVAAADPDAKLYYNDYNLESISNKTRAVGALIRRLQDCGVPNLGVGMQAHLITGMTPSYTDQVANMQAFVDLGVEIAVTELDIRTELPSTPEKEETQAQNYADTVKACVDVQGCVGVTVWDFYDPYSWVPGVFEGEGDATLYRESFERKPAWWAVAEVLDSAAN